ncbi:hypothetical protein [Oceaniglobus roseus]|uniref:hypothetical protein n=1 Tax=Oceaniglobus roseus TaxID=1737570 RepID=UPI0012FFE178|nr:hypothetical protein [Kandeliimicrobium roseum]
MPCQSFAALLPAAFPLTALPSAAQESDCPPGHDALQQAVRSGVKPAGGPANGGLENNGWGVVVNRRGQVSPGRSDGIVYDLRPNGKSASDYGHGTCTGGEPKIAVEIGAGVIPERKSAGI